MPRTLVRFYQSKDTLVRGRATSHAHLQRHETAPDRAENLESLTQIKQETTAKREDKPLLLRRHWSHTNGIESSETPLETQSSTTTRIGFVSLEKISKHLTSYRISTAPMNQSDENPNQNRTEQKNYRAYEEKEGTVLAFRRHRWIRPEAEPQGTSTRAKKESRTRAKMVGGGEKDWGGRRLGRSAAEIRKKKERLGRPWSELGRRVLSKWAGPKTTRGVVGASYTPTWSVYRILPTVLPHRLTEP